MRDRRRQGNEREQPTEYRHGRTTDDRTRKWIDLDDNVLGGYILIDDRCLEPGIAPSETEELPYPEGAVEADDDEDDVGSHGKDEYSIYNREKCEDSRRFREDFDLSTTYPLANSHGNAYKETSSHHKYSELYSEIAVRNYLEANREDIGNYSVANSHGDHSASSENRDRSCRENLETDQMMWESRPHTNYEVANSHSNYRVFYDSQTQQREFLQASAWSTEHWREQLYSHPHASVEDTKQNEASKLNDTGTTKTGHKDSEQNNEATCDIEQCLVQIEESLLNIEQNLLHVQDLDIPELRNLLYKSPSIERSLFEVQDLLYADGIVPVIERSKSASLESDDDDEENEEEEDEEEEVWTERNITVKDNDDEDGDGGTGLFDASNEESSDTANQEENNQSKSVDDRSNIGYVDGSSVLHEEGNNLKYDVDTEKTMNFVPNRLSKTLPRRILLDETKDNIRLCSSEPEDHTIIDYNLNSACAEEKFSCRDKYHSRTNSLDENSTFQNLDFIDKRDTGKISLQNLVFESADNSLDSSGKAKSEGTLQNSRSKSSQSPLKKRFNEKRWSAVEAKAEDFRKKIESIASQHRSTFVNSETQKRTKVMIEGTENTMSRPREKSPTRPRRTMTSNEKLQEKDKETVGNKSFEKRKRRKISSRGQSSSENALVPSKLISLSLSLLLAALLQAVRCLTDLVEDAFKSVSYDRSGLLQ